MADDVEACLSRAHPGCTGLPLVGEAVSIVVVFLFADMQGCEGDIDVSSLVDV